MAPSLNLLLNVTLFLFLLCKVTSMNNLNESNTGFSPEVLGIDDVSNQIEEQKHVELHNHHHLFKPTMEGIFPEQVHLVYILIQAIYPEGGNLVVDTGSDITWMQCKHYTRHYESLCRDPLCKPPDFTCRGGECVYKRTDMNRRSITWGDLRRGTFLYSSLDGKGTKIEDFAMVCGDTLPRRMSSKANGVLGMGPGATSFPSQYSKRFSYCLPTSHEDTTFLLFGDDIPNNTISTRQQASSTPIIRVPGRDKYYLRLTDISVGGKRLKIPRGAFDIRENGGGCYIDTGSPFTVLVTPVYRMVKQRFVRYLKNAGFVKTSSSPNLPEGLGVCYLLKEGYRPDHLTMAFHFDGVDFVIGASQLFVMDLNAGMFCLAMRSSDYSTAIGNYQQRNTRFIYDLEANEIQFYPERCSSLKSVDH